MDVAKYVRIFEQDPDDDYVTKREVAIKDLKNQLIKSKNVAEIMAIGAGICTVFSDTPALPDDLAVQIETAIKKQSPAFVGEERALEMGVCGALAVVEVINSNVKSVDDWTIPDVLAATVWSALSYLPPSNAPRIETLRLETIQAARDRILKFGIESRNRRHVPPLGTFGATSISQEEFAAATSGTIDALRLNASLDREEIELLWWVLSGSSDIFEGPLHSLSDATKAITIGVEIGAKMHFLPTQSHRNLAFRGVDSDLKFSLHELIAELGDDCRKIADSVEDNLLEKAPYAFPLLSALVSGAAEGEKSGTQRPLTEWAARALLERAVLRMQYKDR